MSPLGLALGVVGLVLTWRRGGPPAHLLVILFLLVAAVFVPTPRVADYQPWAMRRFLPVLLPALALGAGTVIGALWGSRRRAVQVVAALTVLAIVGSQVQPTPRRSDPTTSVATSTACAASPTRFRPTPSSSSTGFRRPPVQVPLWLVYGRETIMAIGGGYASPLPALVASGRSIYWIQSGWVPAPNGKGLTFTPIGADKDLTVELPDSPADAPRIRDSEGCASRSTAAAAAGEGGESVVGVELSQFRDRLRVPLHSNRELDGWARAAVSVMLDVAPLASVPTTKTSYCPIFVKRCLTISPSRVEFRRGNPKRK
jgi:hypothetical protein